MADTRFKFILKHTLIVGKTDEQKKGTRIIWQKGFLSSSKGNLQTLSLEARHGCTISSQLGNKIWANQTL